MGSSVEAEMRYFAYAAFTMLISHSWIGFASGPLADLRQSASLPVELPDLIDSPDADAGDLPGLIGRVSLILAPDGLQELPFGEFHPFGKLTVGK